MKNIVLAACGIFFGILLILTVGWDRNGRENVAGPVYYENKAIVLLYHDIRKTAGSRKDLPSTVTPGQFEGHLEMLKDRGFHIVPMEQFVQFMREGGKLPPNAVVLTFDDGYESFYTEALPILKKHGVSASNFIVGISSDLFNPDADPHLNWNQIRELRDAGMGIYNHTYNLHREVPENGTDIMTPALISRMFLEQKKRSEIDGEYRKRIRSDIAFLEKRLDDETGKHRRLLAFPYGAYTDAVAVEGRRAGIELFFSIEDGINQPGSEIVRRINAGEPYMTADALWSMLKKVF
ncbi:polysaccharide deacetylase [Paenibacillus chitinolyticus]|uniref:polysaccharide deacetylase family protein n=1 Tax=Paenibacillus chitinolyticus TaxID=79263 RepID=UPI0026E4DF2C|nr:polysaccharide deacetylase family protein [Paenibacillus chitinolyticus]GKS11628.1 polysaccharide deacetylase [Paenibacillus chitinolyticus]